MEFTGKFKEMMEIEADNGESEKVPEAFSCCKCLLPIDRNWHYMSFMIDSSSRPHLQMLQLVAMSRVSDTSLIALEDGNNHNMPNHTLFNTHLMVLHVPEDEKAIGYFSLQLSGPAYQSQSGESIIQPSNASLPYFSEADASVNPCSIRASSLDHKEDVSATNVITFEDRNANQIRSNLCSLTPSPNRNPKIFSAFCICSIGDRIAFEKNAMLTCGVCQSPHPGEVPKVCLEFDHFLEEQFPEEYRVRRDTLQMKRAKFWSEAASTFPICDFQAHQRLVSRVFTYHFHQEKILYHGWVLAQRSILELVVILVGYASNVNNLMRLSDWSENTIPSLSDNTNEDAENVVDAPLPSSDRDANWRETSGLHED
ncbi:hypothetical protein BUALT_Bualt02G0193300 [Buddleja alternifolia]|uniref:Uncharacterized protein n=1 Tax=Buddleja alternifolia TaxID=168488 RepID=A0AAV6Y9I3_9LAMI|nr:hypothetical protein BUALT_Bualt02G0193300 [Buddleja alternifolia]